ITSFSYVLLRLTQRHRQLSSAPGHPCRGKNENAGPAEMAVEQPEQETCGKVENTHDSGSKKHADNDQMPQAFDFIEYQPMKLAQ
ncbi:MAG: hypothetical protein MZV70_77395, partial [Desulfobacterales bacterium]|nr:hypothetical protein [Desulfobacterales bacterium]